MVGPRLFVSVTVRPRTARCQRHRRVERGERQRIKLATHVGDKGGVYVLDESVIFIEGTPARLVAARSTLTGEHLAAYVGV